MEEEEEWERGCQEQQQESEECQWEQEEEENEVERFKLFDVEPLGFFFKMDWTRDIDAALRLLDENDLDAICARTRSCITANCRLIAQVNSFACHRARQILRLVPSHQTPAFIMQCDGELPLAKMLLHARCGQVARANRLSASARCLSQ